MTQHNDCPRPRVAVIILNWNGAKLLREFLPSVLKFTHSDLGRVIVADNGSTDDSLKVLAEEFPQAEVLRFDTNYGFAEGYNRAIKHYATEYQLAVLLNSDVAVDSDWLTPLVSYMDTHPQTGALQPKILSYREHGKFEYAGACGGFIDRNGYPYCRGRIFDTVEEDKGQYDTAMPVFWATGAALMVRCDAYLAAGGLDAKFFAHMEEIDLCWRMNLLGYEVAVEPASHIYHLGGGSLDMKNPRKTYLNFRNNLLMLHKNLPASRAKRFLIKRRLLDTIAWAKCVATFDWKNAAAILRAHRDFARMRKDYTEHPDRDLLNTAPKRPNIITAYYLRGRKTWDRL